MKKMRLSLLQQPNKQDVLRFFSQLSTLITAGLNLMKCLDIAAQTTDKYKFKIIIESLHLGLESGHRFHACLKLHPQLFDPLTCKLIHLGEETGKLELILKRIMQEQEKLRKQKCELRQALLYPALILITGFLTTLFLLLIVVPRFSELFDHFPQELPAATRFLLSLSRGLRETLPWLLFPTGIALYTFYYSLKKQIPGKRLQKLAHKLPYLRELLLVIELRNFARNLATLLSAGLVLTEALKLLETMSSIKMLNHSIEDVLNGVNAGKSLTSCLEHHSLFPYSFLQMTRIGEESGHLDLLLEKFATLLDADLDRLFHTLKIVLEPLIIVILGVLIGGVVLALYLPIFRLGTVFS